VDPVPHTAEALRELALRGQTVVAVDLFMYAERIRTIVPELIGLSYGIVEDAVTLTLVSSSETLAALDALQYLDGGPCVDTVERAEPVEVSITDLLDEDRWRLYAQGSAAFGVASSLSLPILSGDRVIGGVNLYASTADAFDGRHDKVAEAIGADAKDAITNADLSFSTLREAMEAPARIRDNDDIKTALAIICTRQGVALPLARLRLRNAAARAGIDEAQAARAIRHTDLP